MVLRAARLAVLASGIWVIGTGTAAAWCVRGVASWDTLRIRAAPGAQAREIGGIPPSACGVAITGACRGSWCPVAWRNRQGWSNATYLSRGGLLESLAAPATGLLPPPPRIVRSGPFAQPRTPVTARRPAPSNVADAPPRPVAAPRRPVRDITPPQRIAAPAPPPPPALPPAAPPAQAASPATVGAAVVLPPSAVGKAAPFASGGEVCVINVAKGDTLKVRGGPSLDETLRFGFPPDACGVKLTGPCKDGWCPVDYRGYRGWAEQKFLK